MDNLSPHKSQLTLSLIAQAGAQVLFLPAYSPDLNPIEKMWSKVKQHYPLTMHLLPLFLLFFFLKVAAGIKQRPLCVSEVTLPDPAIV